jgi:sec-independent protein translocase protein TatA
MFGSLGLPELLIIFAIILVVFGAGKLPQLGKGLGEGISNFRDGLKGREDKKPQQTDDLISRGAVHS